MPPEKIMTKRNCVLVHLAVLSVGHGFHGYTTWLPATSLHALQSWGLSHRDRSSEARGHLEISTGLLTQPLWHPLHPTWPGWFCGCGAMLPHHWLWVQSKVIPGRGGSYPMTVAIRAAPTRAILRQGRASAWINFKTVYRMQKAPPSVTEDRREEGWMGWDGMAVCPAPYWPTLMRHGSSMLLTDHAACLRLPRVGLQAQDHR